MRHSGRRSTPEPTPTQPSGEEGSNKISVLFVHSATQPPLGADTWVQSQIVSGLDKSRVGAHVACAIGKPGKPTPTYQVMKDIQGISLVPINLGRERSGGAALAAVRTLLDAVPAALSVTRLAMYIRRHDIAVIHTTDRPRDAVACVVLARLTRARCLVHAHVAFDPAWMGRLLQWAIRRADGLIAISEYVASSLHGAGIESSRIHVVPNAIDTFGWVPGVGREEGRREFGFTPEDHVVLTVCRLFPAKGPTELIRALGLVHLERSDVRLLIVGREMEPGYVDSLKALAAELGLDREVLFAGQRSDVPRLMAAADIYAMPSRFEPFGLVYLEAMAMQLPVVGLNEGGTPEVVENGLDGLLSSAGDVRSIADNLLRLVKEPRTRAEMGRHGRHRAQTMFTTERMARGCESVYGLLAYGGKTDGMAVR
jgi:glycosyltransferase involved in cell wall biosynthesis